MSIKLKPSVCIAWLPFGRIHLKQIIYATVIPVFRQPVQVRGDTSRSLNRSIATHADTLRDIRIVKKIQVTGDALRRIGRCDVALGDTKRRLIRQLRILADTRIEIPHTIRYAEFRERGIRSFSVTLGELSLSDNIQLENVNPLSIGANVQGRVMDYDFRFLVEETSQRGIVQSVKGTYSKDTLLYTPIHIYVERAKVSRYAAEIAAALGLKLHRLTDDFTPSQNFEGSRMTYHDFISALFGWTAKLPQRQINVFIRGDTLHIVQRGMEESVIDITNWPHAQPTVERKLLRSVWHSSHNDSTGAHNEEDTSPVPFTGTISFKEISRTYSNGFLVRETNENGYSTYTYDGEYLAEKRTHNVDGSTSRTDYAYASTGRDVYLFKEWERTTEAVNDGKKHTEYDWEDWSREKGTERITYHAPLGYGWYATTVYVDGVLNRRATSYYKVTVYDRVLVAMTDIRAEEAISPVNARLEERAVDTLPELTLTDFTRLAGRVAGRYIRKDATITPNLLAMPFVMRAGNPVELVLDANGIVVRAEGVALEPGRIGYEIRVRNVRSGKILRGTVIDAATVRIIG